MNRQPWTDQEYGFIADHPDWTATELGLALGRSTSSVQSKRFALRNGWTSSGEREPWSQEEDSFLRSAERLTAFQVAVTLGRTPASVTNRRVKLGLHAPGNNKDPWRIGGRPLIAKTCPRCGLLLAAEWFKFQTRTRNRSEYWHLSCKRCVPLRGYAGSGYIKTHRTDNPAYYSARQAMTARDAQRRRTEYTAQDHAVLSDPDLNNVEKAALLQRTYAGVTRAVNRFGYQSRRGLGDARRDQWLIDNPNAEARPA